MSKNTIMLHSSNEINQLLEKIKKGILTEGGSFSGDNEKGQFSGNTVLGQIKGEYIVEGEKIRINITDKPGLVSMRKIESKIQSYFQTLA